MNYNERLLSADVGDHVFITAGYVQEKGGLHDRDYKVRSHCLVCTGEGTFRVATDAEIDRDYPYILNGAS